MIEGAKEFVNEQKEQDEGLEDENEQLAAEYSAVFLSFILLLFFSMLK